MSRFANFAEDAYQLDEDSDLDGIIGDDSNDEFDTIEERQGLAIANEIDAEDGNEQMILRYIGKAEESFHEMAKKTAANHQELMDEAISSMERDEVSRDKEVIENVASDKRSVRDKSPLENNFYDDIYFDSDSEECHTASNKGHNRRKRNKFSNDELLYDPNIDDENEKWIDSHSTSTMHLRKYHPQSSTSKKPKSKKESQNKTVLSCPSCMSVLCRDCQRHEAYQNQFRAMFVSNCNIIQEQTLRYPNKKRKFSRKKDIQTNFTPEGENSSFLASTNDGDIYHPVQCLICETEVAVYDKDEVYHFFHVLEGIS